jgi:hypothetical protein
MGETIGNFAQNLQTVGTPSIDLLAPLASQLRLHILKPATTAAIVRRPHFQQ